MTQRTRDDSNESQNNLKEEPEPKSLPYSGEYVVKHYPTPPRAPENKGIHPRRPLPKVPETTVEQPEEEKQK